MLTNDLAGHIHSDFLCQRYEEPLYTLKNDEASTWATNSSQQSLTCGLGKRS